MNSYLGDASPGAVCALQQRHCNVGGHSGRQGGQDGCQSRHETGLRKNQGRYTGIIQIFD